MFIIEEKGMLGLLYPKISGEKGCMAFFPCFNGVYEISLFGRVKYNNLIFLFFCSGTYRIIFQVKGTQTKVLKYI